MKRRLISIIVILNLSLICCGCKDNGKANNGNYNYITDCQLTKSAFSQISSERNVAKCETGYYTLTDKKLYYVESDSMQATPLCNKPNCMHNDESCNAEIGVVDNICYSDGYIYYVKDAGEEHKFEGSCLVKISADGSKREEILYMENSLDDWIIHRGNFFYCIRKFTVDESTGLENVNYADCYIYAYPVDKSAEPKEIYFAEEVQKDAQISNVIAYGDNLYFNIYGMERENAKSEVRKTIKLNLESDSATEMISPQGTSLSNPMYLDGLLVFSSEDKENEKYIYYKTDFDGNNPEKFIDTYEGENIICDGKYLYLDNYYALNLSQYIAKDDPVNKNERYIKVFDSELNKIDEISLGNGSAKTWNLLPIDDQVFMFSGKNDEGEFIFYYDKNQLGTIDGNVWDKTFCYRSENGSLIDNDNKTGALSENVPNGSEVLIDMWQKAKDKGYGVKDTFQTEGAVVEGGFSIKLCWEQDNGTITSYFPFLEFSSKDAAKEFMLDYPYSIASDNILVLVGVKSIPDEVYSMLVSVLNGDPVVPIDSKSFSGEMYTFT